MTHSEPQKPHGKPLYNTIQHNINHPCSPPTNTNTPADQRKAASSPLNPPSLIPETARTAPSNPTQNSITATVLGV